MSERPLNLLLILTDQQRIDTLGHLGRTSCRTPNIDRLAAQGISFDRALTPCPLCAPARAAIFTGQYPHQVGMLRNDIALEVPPVLTDRLRDRGYHTAYAGKWHLDAQTPPYLLDKTPAGASDYQRSPVLARWFERYGGQEPADYTAWCLDNTLPDGYPFNDPALRSTRKPAMSIPKTAILPMTADQSIDGWITDYAIRFLRERPKDQPFFLVCSYQGPHPPFKIPEPHYSLHDPATIPEPPNFRPGRNKPQANTTSFYHQLWLDHGDSWAAWQKTVAVYWGFVTLIDGQIGRLLQVLEEEGVYDDTFIIFASDHGELLGQHGLWHKMMPYEEAIRVPLVLRHPCHQTGGQISRAAVSLIDIAPTLLAAAGVPGSHDMAGLNLMQAFNDPAGLPDVRWLFAEHEPLGDWHQAVRWRLVTDNRHKFIWNDGDLDELYDLMADPWETTNLIHATGQAGTLERLQAELRWLPPLRSTATSL